RPPALLSPPDLGRTGAEQPGTLLPPHDGEIPLADDRLDRDRGAVLVSAGYDLEVREHFGLERAVGIGDLGTHHGAARGQVGRGADGRDVRPEYAAGQRANLDFHLLADADVREFI